MRILHVGWGYSPIQRGGTVALTHDLVAELNRRGYRNTYLCGGRYDFLLFSRLVRWRRDQTDFVELRNPPNVPHTKGNPLRDVHQSTLERFCERVTREVRPELIHIHDLIGWSAGTIEVFKRFDIPIILNLENFWILCSRMALFDWRGSRCVDFENGEKCVPCTSAMTLNWISKWRRRAERLKLVSAQRYIFPAARGTVGFLTQIRSGSPDPPRSSGPDSPGCNFALRRKTLVHAANNCDLICTPSFRAKTLLVSHGISSQKVAVVPNGLSHLGAIWNSTRCKAVPQPPLTFGYIGGFSKMKGVATVVAAFSQFDRGQARLMIWGRGTNSDVSFLRSLGGIADIEYEGAFSPPDLPDILGQIDVGIVSSLCEDVYPTTTLELLAGKVPVIGSRIGGISEQIVQGETGLLYDPGDLQSLASCIRTFIDQPDLVQAMSAAITKVRTHSEYADDIERLYSTVTTKTR